MICNVMEAGDPVLLTYPMLSAIGRLSGDVTGATRRFRTDLHAR